MPEQSSPLVDLTGLHAGTYRVGGHDGSLLHAERRDDGTYRITPLWPDPAPAADVRTLLGYLTGPRHLHLHILRQGRCANEDRIMHCQNLTVHTQADPRDFAHWAEFIRALSLAWLTARQAAPGHYYAHAADRDARRCAGPWDLNSIGHTELQLP
ncbi:hypothetical protein [Streptomyces sp. NPDC046925]|uniref:hypothetical protein n=1 Tax=Streptomyces sp. NPDC046925 TaxID=3155375 RepID=UPI0033D829B1